MASTERHRLQHQESAMLLPKLEMRKYEKRKSTHPVFSELLEYKSGQGKWLETGRWIKYEEKVEEGSRRWSKPFVPTTSLVSMLQLCTCINEGIVLLDCEAHEFKQIIDLVIEGWIKEGSLNRSEAKAVRELLHKSKRHQFEQVFHDSYSRTLSKDQSKMIRPEFEQDMRHTSEHLEKYLLRASVDQCSEHDKEKLLSNSNRALFRKLPMNSVTANILVGECSALSKQLFAFVRLKHFLQLPELTEVPVPTKFLFILLGPTGYSTQYRQIGRSAASLMCDIDFQKIPFIVENKQQLLAGVDEFMDSTVVLPPGTWDQDIRIQPTTGAEQKLTIVTGDQLEHDTGTGTEYMPVLQAPGNQEELNYTKTVFGGLASDIKRKIKFYKSDFADGFNLQCVGTMFFMYFAMLAPVVTFGGLLEEGTGQRLAAVENLLAACFCGVTYSLFAGQPLTIIGSTGPLLVCETLIFELCKVLHVNYLPFRFWINFWAAIMLLLVVAFNGSVIIKYVTRFTGESFAFLIASIFIVKAVQAMYNVYTDETQYAVYCANDTMASCECEPLTNNTEWFERLTIHYHWKNSWLKEQAWYSQTSVHMNISDKMDIDYHHAYGNENPDEQLIVDIDYGHVPLDLCKVLHGQLVGNGCYASHNVFFISLGLALGTFLLTHIFAEFKNSAFLPRFVRLTVSNFSITWAILVMVGVNEWIGVKTPTLVVPDEVRPTFIPRTHWWVNPLNDPLWIIPAAIPPAIFVAILVFLDQQLTATIVNRHENKLRKGAGYHLDLFIIAIQVFFMGLFGLPIYVAATVRSMNHVHSLKMESSVRIPGDKAAFVGVREQRLTGLVTFTAIGLSVFLAPVLRHIPMPVLYGVFLYMGVRALDGIQLVERILLMFMPHKYQPDVPYLRHIRISRIHLFTCVQVLLLIVLWVVKVLPVVGIIFPIMFVFMVLIRFGMAKCFTATELSSLDEDLPEPFNQAARKHSRAPEGGLTPAHSPSKTRFTGSMIAADSMESQAAAKIDAQRFSHLHKLPWLNE